MRCSDLFYKVSIDLLILKLPFHSHKAHKSTGKPFFMQNRDFLKGSKYSLKFAIFRMAIICKVSRELLILKLPFHSHKAPKKIENPYLIVRILRNPYNRSRD